MDRGRGPESREALLRVISQSEQETKTAAELPVLEPEELDEICHLDTRQDKAETWFDRSVLTLQRFQHDPESRQFLETRDRLTNLLTGLAARNFSTELPIQEETFAYKRNIAECESLRESVYRVLSILDGSMPKETLQTLTEEDTQRLFADVRKLLTLEKRKAEWLEQNHYPALFERTINAARGEVAQFLIKQLNTREFSDTSVIERLKNKDETAISLRDAITFTEHNKGRTDSIGYARPSTGEIVLKVPPHYTQADEWRIYLTTVHELVHTVTYNRERYGLEQKSEQGRLNAMNEAMTELITFFIAKDHLHTDKTQLQGERDRQLQLGNMSYTEYTLKVRDLFEDIPAELFVDAMLTHTGFEKLKQKFEDVLGSEEAIIKFGKELHGIYDEPPQKDADIIPFPKKDTE